MQVYLHEEVRADVALCIDVDTVVDRVLDTRYWATNGCYPYETLLKDKAYWYSRSSYGKQENRAHTADRQASGLSNLMPFQQCRIFGFLQQ